MSDADKPIDVAIMMGSKSDLETMKPAAEVLRRPGPARWRCACCRRTARPSEAAAFVQGRRRGAAPRCSSAARAARPTWRARSRRTPPVPVIGVPIASGSLGGLDSLLSTVQMPPGMPVATVAIGGAENAGLLAAQIIARRRCRRWRKRVEAERAARRKKVLDSDAEVRGAK